MAKYVKQTGIRLSEDIQKIAWNNIKARSISKKGKPENFSEYLRNLIIEDFNKNNEELKKRLNKNGLQR